MFKIVFFYKYLFLLSLIFAANSVIARKAGPKWGRMKAKDSIVFSLPNKAAIGANPVPIRKVIKIDSLGTITDSAGINITWIDSLKAHNRGASTQKNKIYVIDTLTNQITTDWKRNRIFMDTIDVKNLYVKEQAKTFTRDILSLGSFSQNVSTPARYVSDSIVKIQGNNTVSPFTINITSPKVTPIIIDTLDLPQSTIPIKVNINKTSPATLKALDSISFFYPTASSNDKKLLIPTCFSPNINDIDSTYFWLGGYKTFMHRSLIPTKNLVPLSINQLSCNVSAAAGAGSKFYSFDILATGALLDTIMGRWPFNTTPNTFTYQQRHPQIHPLLLQHLMQFH